MTIEPCSKEAIEAFVATAILGTVREVKVQRQQSYAAPPRGSSKSRSKSIRAPRWGMRDMGARIVLLCVCDEVYV